MSNDTTIWKDIPGYGGRYQVSDTGLVRLLKSERGHRIGLMVLTPGRGGYLRVGLTRDGRQKIYSCHYLVLLAFVGQRPAGSDINHKNGIRTDNRLENLEYCTRQENYRHKVDVLGDRNRARGERARSARLTEDDVRDIRNLFRSGVYRKMQLARMYHVTPTSITKILDGRTWKHVK